MKFSSNRFLNVSKLLAGAALSLFFISFFGCAPTQPYDNSTPDRLRHVPTAIALSDTNASETILVALLYSCPDRVSINRVWGDSSDLGYRFLQPPEDTLSVHEFYLFKRNPTDTVTKNVWIELTAPKWPNMLFYDTIAVVIH